MADGSRDRRQSPSTVRNPNRDYDPDRDRDCDSDRARRLRLPIDNAYLQKINFWIHWMRIKSL
jgi:hypothetical protein